MSKLSWVYIAYFGGQSMLFMFTLIDEDFWKASKYFDILEKKSINFPLAISTNFFDIVCPIFFAFEKLTSKHPHIEK